MQKPSLGRVKYSRDLQKENLLLLKDLLFIINVMINSKLLASNVNLNGHFIGKLMIAIQATIYQM